MLIVKYKIPILINFYLNIAFLIKTYNIQIIINPINQNADQYIYEIYKSKFRSI